MPMPTCSSSNFSDFADHPANGQERGQGRVEGVQWWAGESWLPGEKAFESNSSQLKSNIWSNKVVAITGDSVAAICQVSTEMLDFSTTDQQALMQNLSVCSQLICTVVCFHPSRLPYHQWQEPHHRQSPGILKHPKTIFIVQWQFFSMEIHDLTTLQQSQHRNNNKFSGLFNSPMWGRAQSAGYFEKSHT